MCSCEDMDPNRCYSEAKRRARKQHECFECGALISIGDRYMHASGITYDGDAFSSKWCMMCDRKLRAFLDVERGCGVVFGELRKQIQECARDPQFLDEYKAARRTQRRSIDA